MRNIEVEVRGEKFFSKKTSKVMIRVYKPLTFVQTDKPIYLPGQTGNKGHIILTKLFRMPLKSCCNTIITNVLICEKFRVFFLLP